MNKKQIINNLTPLGWIAQYMPDMDIFDNIDPIFVVNTYTSSITKERRHLIEVNDEVYYWLKENYNQYGIKNPEWYLVKSKVNISDKLLLIVKLKWM